VEGAWSDGAQALLLNNRRYRFVRCEREDRGHLFGADEADISVELLQILYNDVQHLFATNSFQRERSFVSGEQRHQQSSRPAL